MSIFGHMKYSMEYQAYIKLKCGQEAYSTDPARQEMAAIIDKATGIAYVLKPSKGVWRRIIVVLGMMDTPHDIALIFMIMWATKYAQDPEANSPNKTLTPGYVAAQMEVMAENKRRFLEEEEALRESEE